jgi:NADH-quinone oxidoreductase subunit A
MPTNYHELYFPILLQVVIAAAVAAGLVGAGLLLGKRVRNAAKDTPYESGMQPVGSARERFSVKFYLVAMVFILFDIEAIFLYPWAVVYRELKMFAFVEMLLFIVLVLAGFFYIWKKGVLDWSHEAMEAFKDHGSPELGAGYTLTQEPSGPEMVGSGTSRQA